MNTPNRRKQASVLLFSVTLAAFLAFFLYMAAVESVTVYQAEQVHTYDVLTGFRQELVSDNSAPTGLRKIYRGVLDPEQSQESCLCFNIAHHNIQVYFNDTLVYDLSGSETNRIGRNVSSNWCCVHVGQTHAGKAVTVVLTPLFDAAIGKTPEFLLGSHYAIAMDLITDELPLLILSTLCILLGLFVFAVFLYFRHVLKVDASGMNYLGLFSSALGLWKLTDLRCMPLLLPQHTMALGYISVGALFLTGLCLLLYFSSLFSERKQGVLQVLSCCGSILCLLVLAAQVLGITEIRQNLVFSHILLIASVLSVPVAAVYNRLVHKSWGLHRTWKLLALLAVGIGLDLVLYYRNNGNGLLSFSIVGFIVYTLIIFLNSVLDATRKAYTDDHTGLVNRTRWNELMNPQVPLPEPYAILVIDLNGLKTVNDTLGHEAGDRMIFQLSAMLRNTLPRTSIICRWGGDEFTVILTEISRAQLDHQIHSLLSAAEAHSIDHPELPIHFAIGATLSSEHPGISRPELFRLADEEMYRHKQHWYARKHSTP